MINNELKTAIVENKILLFIGAGFSKAAGLPLWSEIVRRVLESENIPKRDALRMALDAEIMTPLDILNRLEETNRKDIFKTFEESTNIEKDSSIHKILPKISKKIVTTNYDRLIEYNTGIESIGIDSPYNLQKIDNNDSFVLKVHGDCKTIDRAIIFSGDYKELYGKEKKLSTFQLEKLVSKYNCLFIGFSLADAYVANLFEYIDSLYTGLGPKHFVISTEKIDYPFVETVEIGSYDDLPALLDEMAGFAEIQIKKEKSTEKTDEKTEKNKEIELEIKSGHDAPPIIEHWIGRVDELSALNAPNKICFITGIGGQGKSALASKYLGSSFNKDCLISDWRDFKEEDLNFQSKIFQIIEKVSNLKITTNQLIGKESQELVDIFFNCLGQDKGIFVFDNVDRYIDLDSFVPTGDMAIFYKAALSRSHNSKFIFTCRPFIHNASIGFYQIKLEGLRVEDVNELLKKYNNRIEDGYAKKLAVKLHETTNGHPLWLNIIIAQSREKPSQIEYIIDNIRQQYTSQSNLSQSSFIADNILKPLWKELKERERIILRTLSVSSIAERESDLAKIVEHKLNYKNFSRAVKQLKSFSLIIEKESQGYIELHPLVREYIKSNFAKEEQESYISLYVSYLDGFILLIKEKLGRVLSSEELGVITKKIEILISSENHQEAINELRRAKGSMLVSGYREEFIRLADSFINKLNWSANKIGKLKGFNDLLHETFTSVIEFGRDDLFEKLHESFIKTFPTADMRKILILSALTHQASVKHDHENAIKYGKSASDLLDVLGESEAWEARNRYNLALRNSRIPENINAALKHFLEGDTADALFNNTNLSAGVAAKLGNVGRCYYFLDDIQKAAVFTIKSYMCLKDQQFYSDVHNLGYASLWLSEVLERTQKDADSLKFAVYAKNIWNQDLPAEANKIAEKIAKKSASATNESIMSLEQWQIKKFCDDWAERNYRLIVEAISRTHQISINHNASEQLLLVSTN